MTRTAAGGAPAVCFVAPSAYPLGGVASWLDRLVPDLRALGWDARVLLTEGDHHDAAAYERAHPAIAPAHRVRCATGTAEGRARALAAALAALPPGVVVSANVPDAVIAAARLRRSDAASWRAAMSLHGLEPDIYRDVALLAPVLDGVIGSNRLAQALAARVPGLGPGRAHYAPCGTAMQAAPPAAGGTFTVGFAGRFERFQKRVQDLAPVARALASRGVAARWRVAGDGPDRRDVEALARAAPDRVELLGPVPPEAMAQRFYRGCHALLNPSAWETGPMVVWEAMACGVAVASARYVGSGLEGALAHGDNCLLFDTGDADAAADALAALADPARREPLCRAAHRLVRERYSPEASASAWAAALEAVASAVPAPGPEPVLPPAGRLDRALGRGAAERVRRAAGRQFRHGEPGGEWPHALSQAPREDPEHWRALQVLDQQGPAGTASARAAAPQRGPRP